MKQHIYGWWDVGLALGCGLGLLIVLAFAAGCVVAVSVLSVGEAIKLAFFLLGML